MSCVCILEGTWWGFLCSLTLKLVEDVVNEVMFVCPSLASKLPARQDAEAIGSLEQQANAGNVHDLRGHVSIMRLRCGPRTHVHAHNAHQPMHQKRFVAGAFTAPAASTSSAG